MSWLCTWFGIGCPKPIPTPLIPPTPTTRFLAFWTYVPNAQISYGGKSGVTNQDGWWGLDFPTTVLEDTLKIDADGYKHYEWVVNVAAKNVRDIMLRDGGPDNPGQIIIPKLEPNHKVGSEAGPLHLDGKTFKDQSGNLWQYRGFTSFRLFEKFIGGIDINPVLDEIIELGANVIRVLGMHTGGPNTGWDIPFTPQDHPDYFDKLSAFVDLLAARGIRLEFTIFADAQAVYPSNQQDHANKVMQALAGKWNVLVETCNEPFKNGVDVHVIVPPANGILRSSGDYDPTSIRKTKLDYVTLHNDRGPEWPRKAKDALDLMGGWSDGSGGPDGPNNFPGGTGCGVVSDEPMGADEVPSGSRSNTPSDFASFAGTAALWTPGATFHSTAGINSNLLGPVQKACAQAFFDAMKFVGPNTQVGTYTRGPFSNCPLVHDDAKALRTFGSLNNGFAYVVVIRPTPDWTPIPQDGWRIDSQNGSIFKMVR